MKYYCFLLLLLLFGCKNASDVDVKEISLVPVVDSIANLNDIAEICEVIPFENIREGMLSDIQKVQIVNSSIFVYDEGREPSIIKFNNKGKYVCHIGAIGHGKNEYDYIDDFVVNTSNQCVAVLTEGHIVKLYNLDGKYMTTKIIDVPEDVWLRKIVSFMDGYVCHSFAPGNKNADILYFFDKDFNLRCSLLKQLPFVVSSRSFVLNPICNLGPQLCFFDFFKHTINIIHQDIVPKCISLRLITDKMVDENGFKDDIFFNNTLQYDFVEEFMCFDNTIYLKGCIDGEYCLSRVNTEDFSVQTCVCGWIPEFNCYNNGFLYSVLPPEKLLSFYEEVPKYPESLVKCVKLKSQHFIQDYSRLSNFVLFKMKIK